MKIIRNQLNELRSRVAEPRRCIQVLAGPRQVGKTTLALQLIEQLSTPYTFLNADSVDPNDKFWIAEQWQSIRVKMHIYSQPEHVLLIDEVQKINNWSEYVKREWDDDTRNQVNIKVVLLGSSRLLLKDGLTESLAGRFEMIRVPHWTYTEMKQAFGITLDQYIYFGGYPGAVAYMDNESRWRKYMQQSIIAPAIEKDVLMTKRILKPAVLNQLFEIGCAYSGELLAHTKTLGQLQDVGNASTLATYLKVLSEANLLTGLQKYAIDFARRYQSIPKYQVYNNALYTVYQGSKFDTDRLDTHRWGRWIESAVGSHLINCAEELDYQVYYWRDRNDEVDFIVKYHDRVIAIEVKSGRRKDNTGLHAFMNQFHPCRTLVVGGNGLTIEDFLSADLNLLLTC